MKRIFGSLTRSVNKKSIDKAVKHTEKIDEGELEFYFMCLTTYENVIIILQVTVAAPKYPTEKKYFDNAQKNVEVKKVGSMGFPLPLPSWESEWLHRNDPVWEYGFYEPPEEKMPKGKLMFREALEVMRAKLELQASLEFDRPQKFEAEKILQEHPAVSRVEQEKLDRMWKYFRPFERRDEQKVVRLSDLAALQEAMHGYSDETSLTDGFRSNFKKMLEQNSNAKEAFLKLEEEEQKLFLEAVKEQRESERKRLVERLAEIESVC
ncbi:unnamed protein product [Anisakis simplex]|uniref:39S ribosomal protein L59, mitochondrial n=1 Tax=Anisakis simplex TaxID=6269 RepID=A0A0M3JVK9_ANISI|nr:unnamed protein product [Anisakis simplex]